MDEKQISEIQELLVENKKLFSELKILRDHLIQTILRLDEKVPTDRMAQFTEILKRPLSIDDKRTLEALRRFDDQVHKLLNMDVGKIAGELKFIGAKLQNIELCLAHMRENGVNSDVKIDVSLNNQKMIPQPSNWDDVDAIVEKPNAQYLDELLNLLNDQQEQVIIKRIGLYGGKCHTFKEIGTQMKLSASRVRDIYLKALRIVSHPKNRNLLKRANNKKIMDEIERNYSRRLATS